MNVAFQPIFCHPNTSISLFWNAQTQTLSTQDGLTHFSVIEGIPILLPQKMQSQTVFDYQEHYQKDAEHFDYFTAHETAMELHENRRLQEYILSFLPADATLILDAGCGKGWAAAALLPKGKKVISMDISTTNPKKVTAALPHPNHLGLVADVFHLPIKKESLNAIIAAEIMEHVPDPKAFVQILFDRLQKGGSLIITTPYNEKRQYSLCIHCNQATPHHAHLHSFHEENVAALIPENAQWQFHKFSNKYLAKLRLHAILKYLPFSIWKQLDKLFNFFIKGEMRMMLVLTK